MAILDWDFGLPLICEVKRKYLAIKINMPLIYIDDVHLMFLFI